MIESLENCDTETCKELVDRVVASNLLCKSARLRDLFLYLCNQVLDESADDIHELELGHKVFGRPKHYDTAADNIVRVHASLLRKRLAEYFQGEGIHEPWIIEIPKGNYAPIFRKRESLALSPESSESRTPPQLQSHSTLIELVEPPPPAGISTPHKYPSGRPWLTWAFGALAVSFACLSVFQFVLNHKTLPAAPFQVSGATVRQFWSGIFHEKMPTQIVLDDASVNFYQEATGRSIALAEYYDRSYMHPIEQAASTAHLDPQLVHSFLLKRQSNFSDVNLADRLSQISNALGNGNTTVQFARDFSFRQMKSGNVILLGTRESNPWIQLYDSHLAMRWKFDPELDSYYPVDSSAAPSEVDKFRPAPNGVRTAYASIGSLPSLGGTGRVLIISGTGGAAVGAALDFLNDETSMAKLRSRLGTKKISDTPSFEVLLRVENAGSPPRNTTITVLRALEDH